MSEQAKVGAGNINIKLGGNEYTLVPSLAAMQGASRINGGIRGALAKVVDLDFDTVCRVVELGIGPKVKRQIEQATKQTFAEACYSAGMTDQTEGQLASKCIEFLSVLSNGGRPAGEANDDNEDPPSS